MVKNLIAAASLLVLFTTATHAQHRSYSRVSQRAIQVAPNHDSPLHCAAVKLHDAVLALQTNSDRFAPSHVEACMVNDLVPLACGLVDATECGVPMSQTLCEIRKVQSQLARLESRIDRYCSPQLHPVFNQQWNCVVREWSNVLLFLDAANVEPTHANGPVPPWLDPRFQSASYQTFGGREFPSQAPLGIPQVRLNDVHSSFSPRSNFERGHRSDLQRSNFGASGFNGNGFPSAAASRGGFGDPRLDGPQPGDIGIALANTILRRLLER